MRASEIVERIPRLTRDDIYNWQRQGYLSPKVVQKGKKAWREYDHKTVKLIELMAHYRAEGFSPRTAREKAQSFLRRQTEHEAVKSDSRAHKKRKVFWDEQQRPIVEVVDSDRLLEDSGELGSLPAKDVVLVSRTIAAFCDRFQIGDIVVNGDKAGMLAGGICVVSHIEFGFDLRLVDIRDVHRGVVDAPDSGVGMLAYEFHDFWRLWEALCDFGEWPQHVKLLLCLDARPKVVVGKVPSEEVMRKLDLRGFRKEAIPCFPSSFLFVPESGISFKTGLKTGDLEVDSKN